MMAGKRHPIGLGRRRFDQLGPAFNQADGPLALGFESGDGTRRVLSQESVGLVDPFGDLVIVGENRVATDGPEPGRLDPLASATPPGSHGRAFDQSGAGLGLGFPVVEPGGAPLGSMKSM